MIDSYFFIPGDKEKYLNKINQLDSEYIVLDLEDAVSKNNKQIAFNNALDLKIKGNTFVRIPFADNCYTSEQLVQLINKFNGRIVFPKLVNGADIEEIISLHQFPFHYKLIILVENPTCFINLGDILKHYSKHIFAIGFGSHDFCSIMGMKHSLKHLSSYKKQLLLLSKAYEKIFIDGVDLNIRDFKNFKEECVYAFEIGVEGKFIIHPTQLQEMRKIQYLSDLELKKLKEVYHKIEQINIDDVDVLNIDGVVYEMPHIIRIKHLMKRINRDN
ncbi:MAG: aldolase/citrate lyase family protein [Bacteroidota bacterium]|nr:aldolase/citrate lyase family protein [Bacteroidota bacterium]